MGWPLAEERLDPFLEVCTGVTPHDQIASRIGGEPSLGVNPTDNLLCGFDRQRRIRGDGLRCLAHRFVELGAFDDQVDETDAEGFGCLEQPSRVEDVLEVRRTDEVQEAGMVRRRQTVTKRSGNRDTES